VLFAPFAHGNRVQPVGEVPARQRFAALTEGFHARAARHQQGLIGRSSVHHTLEPLLPAGHLVDLVHHQQPPVQWPALALQHGAIGRNVPVQVVRGAAAGHQLPRQGGLSHLPRPGQHHHLSVEIGANQFIQIALHPTILGLTAKKSRLSSSGLQFGRTWHSRPGPPGATARRLPDLPSRGARCCGRLNA
jgi:hypothetical protein